MKNDTDSLGNKKHFRPSLVIISIVIILLLLCIALFVCTPFLYVGTFNLAEYRHAQYVDLHQELSGKKNLGVINNSIDAYKKVDEFVKDDALASIEKGKLYFVQFDKNNNIWKVHLSYKYFLFDGLLFEGVTVFVTTDGYVLSVIYGA